MLPEHKEAIIKKRAVIGVARMRGPKRPTRDEFELEELGGRLAEAHQEETELRLIVWNQEESVKGKIITIDSRTKLVHLQYNGEVTKVPFIDIMKVENSQ
ncbi:hypothetical protein BK133_05005 [Paenibacillus sp. FSL H8-0548]|uniref:YolD-like family protein n=1 Tax=Paenibacillus sp. FSL H8-0548 TaxID=1920422 RepID=UPI00096C2390|nr:YolD-like family protein [Paenibacillus sp. FSL H8-0548]OMF37604.1 hypothetical protein BK133_05005 [Paenibacillus sp. FSL H8-0548]